MLLCSIVLLYTCLTLKLQEGRNCGLVEWVDPFWPATMENALTKLWDKYEECRRSKIEDNLESSFAVHNLTQQKIKLQASYERLVEDVNGLLDAQEQRLRRREVRCRTNLMRASCRRSMTCSRT